MHRDAEGQRVVVGVPQQDGDDLHAGRFGKALSALQRPLHRALAVDGVFPHLAPGFRASACSDTTTSSSSGDMVRGYVFFKAELLTSGRRAAVSTVSGTTGDAAEGGTEPRTETAAASTAGGGRHKASGGITLISFC